MQWYVQFMNPYSTTVTGNAAGGNSASFSETLYDAAIGEIIFTTAAGTAGVSRDTAVVNWDANALRDTTCPSDGAANIATCVDDTSTNDLTAVTANPDDQCTEKWNLADPGIRCVRIQSQWSRKFLSPDTSTTPPQDFDLGYRPFQVSAGWKIGASPSTTPLLFAAARQSVDFGRFIRGAPESDFNGATTGMGVTCASLAAAVMTFLF